MSSDPDELYSNILKIEVNEITDVNNYKIEKIRELFLLLKDFITDYRQDILDFSKPKGLDYINLSGQKKDPVKELTTENDKYSEDLEALLKQYRMQASKEKKNEIKREILNILNNQYRKYLNTLIYYRIGIKFKKKCDEILKSSSQTQQEESEKQLEKSKKELAESKKELTQKTKDLKDCKEQLENYNNNFQSYKDLLANSLANWAESIENFIDTTQGQEDDSREVQQDIESIKLSDKPLQENLHRMERKLKTYKENNRSVKRKLEEERDKAITAYSKLLQRMKTIANLEKLLEDVKDLSEMQGYLKVFKIDFFQNEKGNEFKYRITFFFESNYSHVPNYNGFVIQNYNSIDKITEILTEYNNEPMYRINNLINYLNIKP